MKPLALPPLLTAPLLVVLLGGCLGPVGSPIVSVGEVTTVSPSPSPSPTASGHGLPGIPAGFPVMPGMVADQAAPSETGLIARWTTEANGAEVYAFLQEALPDAGYHVDLLAPGGAVAVIRFTPPDGEQLQIDLGVADGGTVMELRVPHE